LAPNEEHPLLRDVTSSPILTQTAGFFVGRLVVLDLAVSAPAIAHLIDELASRNIRIYGDRGHRRRKARSWPPSCRALPWFESYANQDRITRMALRHNGERKT
jgi:hypothetical protein